MEVKGEQDLAHAREAVWEALIDPEVLAACVPGCQSFELVGENRYKALMKAEVGPVSARFSVEIRIVDPDPPKAYRLEGSAKAPVGFGRGVADVQLAEDGAGGTKLSYTAQLQLGGKLAQVGSRLLSGITHKIAAHFFARLAEILDGRHKSAARSAGGGALNRWFARPVLRWLALGLLLALAAAIYLLNRAA
ncbi:CoxG family protein [Candidatus Foliamicus sp.]